MPYLGQVTIAGPEPAVDRRQHFLDALDAAMAQGWRSLRILPLSEDDLTAWNPDLKPRDRKLLDYRTVGYRGGATITALMDGEGLEFEEATAALTSLGRHLTTWSPELLEYSLQKVEISRLGQGWNRDNWLRLLDGGVES